MNRLDRLSTEIVSQLLGLLNMMNLYPNDHPKISEMETLLFTSFNEFFSESDDLTFLILGETIFINDRPAVSLGPLGDRFYRLLSKKSLERLTFAKGLSLAELVEFLTELRSVKSQSVMAKEHIRIGRIMTMQSINEELVRERWTPEVMTSLFDRARDRKTIVLNDVNNLASELIELFNQSSDPLKYLVDIKSEDEYTYIHTINVALLTMRLAMSLGFVGNQLKHIAYAALVHDIGKVLIPIEILNKPGQLSDNENDIMKTHPLRGAQYIANQQHMPPITILAALEHHIKFDGSGYPFIREGWRPHIITQMISIADVYDALRSRRPYREPMPHDKILSFLQSESGSYFNPLLVSKMQELIII